METAIFWSWLLFLLSICVFLTLQVHSSVKLICLLSYLRDSYQTFAVDYMPSIRNLLAFTQEELDCHSCVLNSR